MINHKKMPSIETIPEKVNRYTELLLVSDNKYEIENAFLRLFQIDTSIRVYEKCRLEYILRKRFDGNINYLYQVNRLFKKIAQLRRKEQKIKKEERKEEEYDPEFPCIRSSIEMERYPLPKSPSDSSVC
uniref:Uncharacterized protein n=1 Tax=Caenorhabditis tropicalis TaxID=1561998 RepID=A0A1I7TGJ0_9PELO